MSLRIVAPVFWRCFTVAGGFFFVFVWAGVLASARDLGQWGNQDPATRKWFNSLTVPDNPWLSCCGNADAYWTDSFEVNGDQYVAIITDRRPDAPLGRPHIEPGTRVVIPNHRIKWDKGNPTGHGWIFLGGDEVFCYLPPGGV